MKAADWIPRALAAEVNAQAFAAELRRDGYDRAARVLEARVEALRVPVVKPADPGRAGR